MASINYQLLDVIGQGSYGQVYRARHKLTHKIVAIKVFDHDKLERMNENDRLTPSNEIKMMQQLSHPNIIEFYESFATPTEEYLIMEYAEHGDLLAYINVKSKLSEHRAWRYFNHMIQALHYIHQSGYIHGDIKLENILICAGDIVKLTDLGFVTAWNPNLPMTFGKGSINYASPEILLHRPFYGPETDIWSLGIVLYAMVSGNLPLTITHYTKAAETFRKFDARKYYSQLKGSSQLQDLLCQMHEVDLTQRITMARILMHVWVTTEPSLVPTKRSLSAPSSDDINATDSTATLIETKRAKDMTRRVTEEMKSSTATKDSSKASPKSESSKKSSTANNQSLWQRLQWLWSF